MKVIELENEHGHGNAEQVERHAQCKAKDI
jgi:hypothetical protein